MLETRGLTKSYARGETPAVLDVSFKIPPGQIAGLVGLNGAGKSTLIRMIAGVLRPTRGTVQIRGADVYDAHRDSEVVVGWAPEVNLHDKLSRVSTLLGYYVEQSTGVSDRRVEQDLDHWGLASVARRRVGALSLGQQRRLAILVADLTRPRFLLLDEIFNGLDPAAMDLARKWIRERREAGVAMMISSHNLRELYQCAERFVVLHRGRLISDFGRDSISERGPVKIRIRFESSSSGALEVASKFGEVSVEGDSLVVAGVDLRVGQLVRELSVVGTGIRSVEHLTDPIESHFLRIVAEAG